MPRVRDAQQEPVFRGTMECDFCGNLVDVLDIEGENAMPVLSKELFMEVKILGTVAC